MHPCTMLMVDKLSQREYSAKEDIEAAIGNCNFNKAIGVDWFSGKSAEEKQ